MGDEIGLVFEVIFLVCLNLIPKGFLRLCGGGCGGKRQEQDGCEEGAVLSDHGVCLREASVSRGDGRAS